jgi:hypothetical protein
VVPAASPATDSTVPAASPATDGTVPAASPATNGLARRSLERRLAEDVADPV